MDDDVRTFSWGREFAMAAAMGTATTLMPVHRWSTGSRWALHGGFGLATAAGCVWVMRHPGEPVPGEHQDAPEMRATDEPADTRAPSPWPLTLVAATGAGALMVAVSRCGEALDHAAEKALVQRRVVRPRWWIGGAAALLSLALSLVDSRYPAPPAGRQDGLREA